jgi:hypothetical protein
MYQGRDQNLQFDRATMWKMDIGSSYNILKVAEQLAFQRYFNSMNFALLVIDHTKQNGQFNWKVNLFI